MVNVPELGSARSDEWLAASTDWKDLGTGIGGVADQVDSEVTGIIAHGAWTGSAATAAHLRMQAVVTAMEAAHGEINAVSDVLEGLGQAIIICQRALEEAQQMASQHGLTIGADGTVSGHHGNVVERLAEDIIGWVDGKQASPAQIAEIQDLVTQTLRRATQADEEAAQELRKIASHAGLTDPQQTYGVNQYPNADGLAASRLELEMIYQSIPTAPPSVVSQWWANLSSEQKATLMEAAPGKIGTIDGIPDIVKTQLIGSDGINRVALVNYALNNTLNGAGDVPGEDNCTNFTSDALQAAGLREMGNLTSEKVLHTDSNVDNNWYKEPPQWPLGAGSTRSHSWGGAGDLHEFLTHNGSKEVAYSQALPGDVAFFKDPKEGIYHAAVITAKVNGQVFYSQHTPGEQNADWGSRQTMPGITDPNNPSSIIIVRPGQDHSPVPTPQAGATPTPPASPVPQARPNPQPNQRP